MSAPSQFPAVILAGGLGTRLKASFAEGPKSMAPVGGAPLLHYLLNYLKAWDVKHIVLCVGYKRTSIRNYCRGGRNFGLHIDYSVETTLRGTGGAIANAASFVQSDCFWVLNGDTFFDVKLSAMREFHAARGATVTVALSRTSDAARYGAVTLNRAGAVTSFTEKKPAGRPSGGSILINGGMYLCGREILSMPIMSRQTFSLERDVMPSLIGAGLYGYPVNNNFIDIGIPSDYELAQGQLPRWFKEAHYDNPG